MVIYFDKEAIGWTEDKENAKFFLQATIRYIKELIKARRYIYLNQICEMFGVDWEPSRRENICYLNEFGELLFDLKFDEEEDRWEITIRQSDES